MANNRITTTAASSNVPYSVVRNYNVKLVRAFADHLEANTEADVLEGLSALVLHMQGDEDEVFDDGELLRALTSDVLEKWDSFPALS